MPVLANAKHELFAQNRAKGMTQIDAFEASGFAPNIGHASRLASNPLVAERVTELLAEAATETITTIYDIARQLDEDREFARGLEAPGPAITATMSKAKVLGLLTEKVEPIDIRVRHDITDVDLARLIAFQLTKASK